MARTTTRTQLPLDRWAEILGVDPLHFNQVSSTVRPNSSCSSPWKQYAWQESDRVGREDVAQAIQQAEDTIIRELGYNLIPTWEVDERLPTVRPGIPELLNQSGLDLRGFAAGVQTQWGHFVSGGIEAKSLIEAGVAVNFSDEDGDLYEETATIITATDTDADGNSVTDESEVAVYFPGTSAADEWEIRPLRTVVIAGGTITIRMWRHQLVDPDLTEGLTPTAVDGATDGDFTATLDVYRHRNDPQTQTQLIWSNRPDTCDCGSGTCTVCTLSTQYGCLTARDYRTGLVTYSPATWDSDDLEFQGQSFAVSRAPDRLRLWYYAGHQDTRRNWPTLQMDPSLERAVAYYSLAILDRPLCGCDNLERLVRKWSEDLSLNLTTPANSVSYGTADRVLNNPLGTSRGAIAAWNIIRQPERRVGKSVRY